MVLNVFILLLVFTGSWQIDSEIVIFKIFTKMIC